MPGYDGFTLAWLHRQLELEAAIYNLLDGLSGIPTSKLLYYRHSEKAENISIDLPKDISGRRLMIFEMRKDSNIDWRGLDYAQKVNTA